MLEGVHWENGELLLTGFEAWLLCKDLSFNSGVFSRLGTSNSGTIVRVGEL
jgi:hypothetical protein